MASSELSIEGLVQAAINSKMLRLRAPSPHTTPPACKHHIGKISMTSTTRSTAGPGYDFEDQIGAWILLSMLHGEPLWGAEPGTRMQMQAKAKGWKIDDILVTSGLAPKEQFRALSCKSNLQVTAEKLPVEFVANCWRQWFQPDPNPMRKGKDGFVLVTRGRNNEFMATWSEIKSYSRSADPQLALGRIQETKKFGTMFSSLKNPAKAAGFEVEDTDVLALIRAIDVHPCDFQIAGSEAESMAITRSRHLLKNGSHSDGQDLWRALVAEAHDTRVGSGTLNLTALQARLRTRHSLRDHPDYAKSWATLRAISSDTRDRIETTLATGVALARSEHTKALLENLASATVSVIFGDSGSGKSALLKAALDSTRPGAEQVWLDPSSIDQLLNHVTRVTAGLEQPLPQVLRRSTSNVVLVIDAAERLSPESMAKVKALLNEFSATSDETGCRIVVVGQTDASVDGRLQDLAGIAAPAHEVKTLPTAMVRQVLRSTGGLAPLASAAGAVHALSNLRTLSWVVQAASRFHVTSGSATLSLSDIADRLWDYWTDSKASVQSLLMRLAERESSFEHSFAISELNPTDAAAFDARPTQCPLRRDALTGRIRFAHDLASEWARFQRLRELSDDVSSWQAYAGNPFWHGPIRMLGQHLFRVRMGARSGWEVAYEKAEQNRVAASLTNDLLLDALFLDPDAEALLESQADRLFADGGRRLIRLIKRFEHVASEPRERPTSGRTYNELSLYIEAEFRTPIYGRWPPMARFLSRHQARVAPLLAPEVSKLCERWLSGTPTSLDNAQAMPYRAEFARLALACARELQITMARRDVYGLHDPAKAIFQAALAGGHDLPAEVSAWALEMCGRRAAHVDVQHQVATYRAQQAEEHTHRMASDAEYRKRQERLRDLPTHIPSGRKLPPWPLGPQHPIERSFREATLGSGALSALMHALPDVAAEILLACIIEDDPTEEYSPAADLDYELGIAYCDESYPTSPWKSPFLLFLSINPKVAVPTLIQLVDFATERWAHAVERWERTTVHTALSLRLQDGSQYEYAGFAAVFNWSHDSSHFIGQLHSSLAALEQWLCDLPASTPVATEIVDLVLRSSRSAALIGVLSNLAKAKPELLQGPLRCLAGSHHVHAWDSHRVEVDGYTANLASFLQGGQLLFEMGKQWLSRPYRIIAFTDVIVSLIGADAALGDYVIEEIANWVAPDGRKAALEFELLRARLDHRNYQTQLDPKTGESLRVFVCPAELIAAATAFDTDNTLAQQILALPRWCDQRLNQPQMLQATEASQLTAILLAIDADSTLDLDEDMKASARSGAACLLALRAPKWLEQNPQTAERVARLIQDEVEAAGNALPESGPARRNSFSALQFVAWFAVERWVQEPSRYHEQIVLKVLVSGDETALATLFFVALAHRKPLGPRWWRLLHVALLWSGLLMLKPRYGDEGPYTARWERWRRWLAARSLSIEAGLESIKPIPIATAVGRLDHMRARRRRDYQWQAEAPRPAVPWHGGLHDGVLEPSFAWLIKDKAQIDGIITLSDQTALLSALWRHQAWWLSGSEKNNGDFQLMSQFGYSLVARLALVAHRVPAAESVKIWQPVFELGPRAHHAISHFLSNWFMLLSESASTSAWTLRWRMLIDFTIGDPVWRDADPWYHRESLTRKALGLHSPDAIARVSGHSAVVFSMKDQYRVWADQALTGAEENLSEFCYFLATEAGKVLRLDGLGWISAAKASKPEFGNWYRQHTSSNFLDFLNMLVAEHGEELRSSPAAKTALLDLATLAAAKQLKAAMQLLERIQHL